MLTGYSAPRRWLGWCLSVAFLPLLGSSPAAGQDAGAKESRYITVPNPITGTAFERIKSTLDGLRNRPNGGLEKVVFDFNPEGKEAYTASFGTCADFAEYIKQLNNNNVSTIAFLSAKTSGHTVLPAIACGELAMTEAAEIGDVVDKGTGLPPVSQIQTYVALGKPQFKGLYLKMIDPRTEVYSGIRNQGKAYIDGRDKNVKENGDLKNPQPEPTISPDRVESFKADRARRLGLCMKVVENRAAVIQDYGVVPDDGLDGRVPKACRVEIIGPINDELREKLRRQFRDASSVRDNTIFFTFNSDGGGEPKAARELADDIIELRDADGRPIRTIAFIPNRAPDLAGVVAMACTEIVMYKGAQPENEATIGNFEEFLNNPKSDGALDYLKRNLPEILAKRDRPEALATALLMKDAEVFRARNQKTGARALMTKAEFDRKNADGRDWNRDGTLKQPGSYLKLNATQAEGLRLAARTVDSRDIKDLVARYGFDEKDVRDAKPHWLDNFGAFLRQMQVAALLILIGVAGLILELKIPGLTVPGIISALCFLLFFWSQSQLGGQIIYLAVLLFMLGIALIGIEIFLLPGFGVPGVAGVLLIIAGLGLATVDHIPQSPEEWGALGSKLSVFGGSMVGSIFVVMLVGRFLPKIPFANRMVLLPPSELSNGDPDYVPLPGAERAAALLGEVGTATSTLRPAGLARIKDEFVDVVTEGDFIDAGTPVQVIEVEGTRIVVKRVG